MRFLAVTLCLAIAALPGCKLIPPTLGPDSQIAGEGADMAGGEATASAGMEGGKPTLRPKPRPITEGEGATEPAAPEPASPEPVTAEPAPVEAVKSDQQIICEKQGGKWQLIASTNVSACIKLTRDGGKQCEKESDCDGVCLARSRTCAPVKPLFGCNEILQDDGRRATLCIN